MVKIQPVVVPSAGSVIEALYWLPFWNFKRVSTVFHQERFLFGTAYPLMPIVDCVSRFKALFRAEALPNPLRKNAAKL